MGLAEHFQRNKSGEQENFDNRNEADVHRQLKAEVHDELLDLLDLSKIDELPPDEQEEAVREDVTDQLAKKVSEGGYRIDGKTRERLIEELIDKIVGLGPLQPLIERDDLAEIMVNGPEEIYVEPRDGDMHQVDISFQDEDHVIQIINKIVRPLGRRVDDSQPYTDARLPDGSRVNVIIPPLIEKPSITIRDFRDDLFTVDELITDLDSFTRRMADFLEACVKSKLNIIISGGTGSGKTTTLNILSNFIPDGERILSVEDTRELQIQTSHVLYCESRPPNIEGEGEVTIRELVRNSLRMRPSRIIVGECRGAEALDMLQAMNTGHEGSMTTVHSNSPRDAISRLETLGMMAEMELPQHVIRSQIASAVDVVLQQDRMQDGSRKITKISEVVGMEGDTLKLNDIFLYDQEDFEDGELIGKFRATGVKPSFHEKFERLGMNLDSSMYVQNY